eukprot:scaffold11552_cov147-Skeletonema_marinoi.AAC.1
MPTNSPPPGRYPTAAFDVIPAPQASPPHPTTSPSASHRIPPRRPKLMIKRTALEIEQQLQRRGSRRYTNWPSTVEAGALQIGPSSPRKAGDQQIGPGYT